MAIIRRVESHRLPGSLPTGTEYRNAEEVHDAARKNGISTRPFDIEKFIRMHNINVVREEMADNDISGYIELRPGDQWVIGVNTYHNPRRQRFTMAHEFAHFCLHKDFVSDHKIMDVILFRDTNSDLKEKDANELASQILIPDHLFKSFVTERTRDIRELAEVFDVSPAAIRYKAWKLGLIPEY